MVGLDTLKRYNVAAMEPYQIILLIVVLVSFVYVTLAVYVLGMMAEFSSKLKRKRRALNLLLYERGDALLRIVTSFESIGVTFTDEDSALFAKVASLDYKNSSDESLKEVSALIKAATSRMRYIAQANRWACKDEDYQNNIDLIDDLERNYRTFLGSYNADVMGFNYWIAIPTIGWLGWLFGFRKKSSLN